MLEFSNSKIILYWSHVDKNEGESVIGYDMIVVCDLMVQLRLSADFKHQGHQWDGVAVPMKQLRGLLGQTGLTSREMCEVRLEWTYPSR